MEIKADLHCHSTHSDGTWDVDQILKYAEKIGLKALAISDHDNLNGSREAIALNKENSIFSGALIPAIEISTKVCGRTTHLLAYLPESRLGGESKLNDVLSKIQNSRKLRMEEMVRKANTYGFAISLDEVEELMREQSKGDVYGRPHLARLLVRRGYASSMDDAFDNYLSEGKPLYASRFSLDFVGWAELIHELDGILVWAHPLFYQDENLDKLAETAHELEKVGLDGVEFHYEYNIRRKNLRPKYIEDGSKFLLDMIAGCDLLATAGGDFHGDGGILGNLKMAESHFERLVSQVIGK